MNTIDRILELLNTKGVTRNRMLKELGLNTNSFVNWTERGTSPSGETLSKIAGYFGVTTDYLIHGVDNFAGLKAPATDEQLKFALYGDTDIDDDVLNAVKQFAEFQLEQMKKKGKKQ